MTFEIFCTSVSMVVEDFDNTNCVRVSRIFGAYSLFCIYLKSQVAILTSSFFHFEVNSHLT